MTQLAEQGGRKFVLTKMMLTIFSVITICYMILVGYMALVGCNGIEPCVIGWTKSLSAGFYMEFVFGLGAIGGAFTVGNIFEHQNNATVKHAEYIKNTIQEKIQAATVVSAPVESNSVTTTPTSPVESNKAEMTAQTSQTDNKSEAAG